MSAIPSVFAAGPYFSDEEWKKMLDGAKIAGPALTLRAPIDPEIDPAVLAYLEAKFREPMKPTHLNPLACLEDTARALAERLNELILLVNHLEARIAELEKQTPPIKPEMTASDYAAQAFRMDHIPDSYGR